MNKSQSPTQFFHSTLACTSLKYPNREKIVYKKLGKINTLLTKLRSHHRAFDEKWSHEKMRTKLYLTFFLLLSLWYWPQLKWLAYTPVVVLILALPHRTQHCQHSLVLPMDCTPAAKGLGRINPGFRNAYLPHSGKPDFSPHDVKQHKRGRNTHTHCFWIFYGLGRK
jgi:hypothetical protein